MKILHVNDNYCHLGGTEKYLLDTCCALEEAGHQIVIISSSGRGHIRVQGRKEYFVKSSYGLRSGLRIWGIYKEIVERERPDIIHLHNTHYFVSPLIIKRLWRLKPTIKFVHDARFFCPSFGRKVIPSSNEICPYPVGRHCFNRMGCYPFHFNGSNVLENLHKFVLVFYELRISRMLDRIVVGSQYMHDELVRNKFAVDRIKKIPCYTDKNKGCDIGKCNEEKGLILCIGRFEGGKALPLFIEALNYLKDQQWHAEIIGDGGFIKEAKERAKSLGFEKRIKFVGRLSSDEIDRSYNRCSMIVMPSITPESFGIVGIEAMAFGKPVIAFDSCGVREWLADGETGFLVKRREIKGLAGRISQLLEDEGLAMKMGQKGKERVEKRYRKEMHLKQLLTIYEEAINSRRGRGIPR